MGFYADRILPHLVDKACSTKPSRKQREKIVPLARGDVLEVGFGSGLNLPFYSPVEVRKILALEPSAGMRQKARPMVERSGLDVEFIDAPAESIPLPADSVDTVVSSYTLCTIPDAAAALDSVRRVLRPGGQLLFCEHGLAPDADVRRWQRRLSPAWSRVAGGCNMDRDIPALLAGGGFETILDERMYIPGLRILSYNYWGIARMRR